LSRKNVGKIPTPVSPHQRPHGAGHHLLSNPALVFFIENPITWYMKEIEIEYISRELKNINKTE
jgi:hypothetical protein